MKNLLIYFFFIPLFTFAQKPFYFSKAYDFGFNECGTYIRKNSNKIIVGSKTWGGTLTRDLFCFDERGVLEWHNRRPTIDLWDIKIINDTIYCASHATPSSSFGNKNDLVFEALTMKGEPIFTRTYGKDTLREADFYFEKTEDGGFIFAETKNFTIDYKNQLYIFKTDKKGNVEWDYSFGVNDSLYHFLNYNPWRKLANDQYLLTFFADKKNDPDPKIIASSKESKQYLYIFDAKGKILKKKEFGNNTIPPNTYFYEFDKLSNNNFFGNAIVYKPDSVSWDQNITVIIDSTLNVIKVGKKIPKKKSFIPQLLRHFEFPNGDVIGIGLNENNDSTSAFIGGPYIAKFDKNANLLWERIIIDHRYANYKDLGLFFDGTLLSNGDILLGGYVSDKKFHTDMWLLRVDTNGCPFPNCKGKLQFITNTTSSETLSVEQLSDVNIFPNPVQNQIWIELFDKASTDYVRATVTDYLGRSILEQHLNATDSIFNLDVSCLQPGTYMVRIQDKNGKFIVKKFIKL